jgi:hypothetical protein
MKGIGNALLRLLAALVMLQIFRHQRCTECDPNGVQPRPSFAARQDLRSAFNPGWDRRHALSAKQQADAGLKALQLAAP